MISIPAEWVDVIQVTVIPFCYFIVRRLGKVEKKVTEISVTLVGMDGRNGLRSRVEKLEEKVDVRHIPK